MPRPGRRTRQLLWFVGLWLAGVATVTALAYGIRLWMAAATG
jgi:hypothetical protein